MFSGLKAGFLNQGRKKTTAKRARKIPPSRREKKKIQTQYPYKGPPPDFPTCIWEHVLLFSNDSVEEWAKSHLVCKEWIPILGERMCTQVLRDHVWYASSNIGNKLPKK